MRLTISEVSTITFYRAYKKWYDRNLYNNNMKVLIKDLQLKMWSKTEMPEALKGADGKMVKDANGKIQNTGKTLEYTVYTFRDLVGEVLEIMSAKNQFRELEGKDVDLILNLTKRSFQGKSETKINIDSVLESKPKK